MSQYDLGELIEVVSFARSSEREVFEDKFVIKYQIVIKKKDSCYRVMEFIFMDNNKGQA